MEICQKVVIVWVTKQLKRNYNNFDFYSLENKIKSFKIRTSKNWKFFLFIASTRL